MAQLYNGTTTISSTNPTLTLNIGFRPYAVRITYGPKDATVETYYHRSMGIVDTTGYVLMYTDFKDSTSEQHKDAQGTSAKIISHYERISGTLTEIISATWVGFTSTGFTLNAVVTGTTAGSYTAYIECWG